VTTVTEVGAILARQNSAVFLVVLSCADSEPLRRQCNAKLDVAGIYADALEAVPETMDGQPPMPLERECPVTLDDLLAPPRR
jgi:hypothetical protein